MRQVLTDRSFLAICADWIRGGVLLCVRVIVRPREHLRAVAAAPSLVFAANAVGLISASQLNARLVGRLGSSRMLSAGVMTLGCGALWLVLTVLFVPKDLLAILPPLFLVVSSVGLVAPNATALALNDFPESAGSASAVLGVLQFGIGALVAPLAGLGGSHDAHPMALLIILLALGSGVCRASTLRATRRSLVARTQ